MRREVSSLGLLKVLVAATVAASAIAAAAPPKRPVAKPVVTCTPCCGAEFVDDLKFRNVGSVTIPRGSDLGWQIAGDRDQQHYTLSRNLVPGTEIVLRNVLHGRSVQSPCTVVIYPPYEAHTYSMSPSSLNLTVGEQRTVTISIDTAPTEGGAGVVVRVTGPPGIVTIDGGRSVTSVNFGVGDLAKIVWVRGVKAGGPVLVSATWHEHRGGPELTVSTRVTVRPPIVKQPVEH